MSEDEICVAKNKRGNVTLIVSSSEDEQRKRKYKTRKQRTISKVRETMQKKRGAYDVSDGGFIVDGDSDSDEPDGEFGNENQFESISSDSTDSLQHFIVEEGQEFVLADVIPIRQEPIYYFRFFVKFLIKAVSYPFFVDELYGDSNDAESDSEKTKEDKKLRIAVDYITRKLDDYKVRIVSSEAWKPEFKKAIEVYSLLSLNAVDGFDCYCEACSFDRHASMQIILAGPVYNEYYWVKSCTGPSFNVGSTCCWRSGLYHSIHHFVFHRLSAMRNTLVQRSVNEQQLAEREMKLFDDLIKQAESMLT